MKTRDLAQAALMTALVFVITRTFVIPIPQTKGFFNLGEAGVFMAAILFGPVVGAVAGGVGSALADLSLGYAQYAPFTLVIKGLEGVLVGLIARGSSRQAWTLGLVAGAIAGVWLFAVETAAVRIAAGVLLITALGALALLAGRRGGRAAARVAGMIGGGLVMVAGYFVSQAYVLGLGPLAALAEIPYNLVQVVVGVVGGLAAVVAFERAIHVAPR